MPNHKRILTEDLAPLMHTLGEFTLNQLMKALNEKGMVTLPESMRSRLFKLAKKIDPVTKKPSISRRVDGGEIYYHVSKRQSIRLCEQIQAAESRTFAGSNTCSSWGSLLTGKPGTTVKRMAV